MAIDGNALNYFSASLHMEVSVSGRVIDAFSLQSKNYFFQILVTEREMEIEAMFSYSENVYW